MKVRRGVSAALVAGAAAQTTTPSSAWPVSYTTMTVDDCPSASLETLITVTQGLTITYCPECEMGPTSKPIPTGHHTITIYTVTYMSLCPTGTVPATYTVTESCTEATPTWTHGPDHIPDGFTVTVKTCHACDTTPVPVTITEPCGCEATGGVPAPAKPMPTPTGKPVEQIPDGRPQNPVQQIPDGQVQNPAPGSGSGSGGTANQSPPSSGGSGSNPSKPAPPAESSPAGGKAPPAPSAGSNGGASAPPYPTTPAAAAQCPGPECRAKATGGAAGPSGSMPSGSTSAIPPYEGMASTSQLGYITSILLSFIVGGLAFAL